MSTIGFNPNVNAANAANHSLEAKTPSDAKVAPPFVRGGPSPSDVKARRLDDFTQIRGIIPRHEAVVEGFTGSINELKATIGSGDISKARGQLDRIATYQLDSFFKAEGINPKILKDLKAVLMSNATPAEMLKNVDLVLKNCGYKPSNPRNW